MDLMDRYLASDETIKERTALCEKCPSFVSLTKMCSTCLCVIPMKVRMKPASCPEGKWLNEIVHTESS